MSDLSARALRRDLPSAQSPHPTDGDAQSRESNLLLRGLPRSSYERLRPHLEHVELKVRYVLWAPNEPIDWVHFPRSLVGSVLVLLDSEPPVEAATIGREGFFGTPILFGADSASSRSIVQVEGDAVRISASAARDAFATDAALVGHCLRYAHALQEQVAQSVACNSRHALEERCARWLLMTHDRVGRDEFVLLQSFLASMLGVHRPRVTVAAGMLQQAGLIRYSRGRITITDRERLEAAACECYATVRATHERLFAAPQAHVR
jgi:CRP-like cAMP-binding protein